MSATFKSVTRMAEQVRDHVNFASLSTPSIFHLVLWPSCGHLLFWSFFPGRFLKSSIPFWADLVSPRIDLVSVPFLCLTWCQCTDGFDPSTANTCPLFWRSILSDQSFPVSLRQFHPLFAYQHRGASLRLAICRMSL
jgi:hypothetical protein